MTLELRFFVPGKAAAWSRAGLGQNPHTGKPIHFTNKKLKSHEGWVATCCISAARAARWPHVLGKLKPLTGPIVMHLVFLMPRPQRLCRKKDEREQPGRLWCPTNGRNDIDNLQKAVFDGISKSGIWTDDGLVVAVVAQKLYHAIGEGPGTEVYLRGVSLASRPEDSMEFRMSELA